MRIHEPGGSTPRETPLFPHPLAWPTRPAPHEPTAPRAPEQDGFSSGGRTAWVQTRPDRAPGRAPALDDREELRELRRELAKRAAASPSLEQRRAEAGPGTQPRAATQASEAIGPKPRGTQAKADWYRAIVEQAGGKWRTGPDQVNIVGLRGQSVDGRRNHNPFNQWNDTIAYVSRGRDPRP